MPCRSGRTAFHARARIRKLRRELAKIIVERAAHDVVVMAANFTELTGDSPEVVRQYYGLWPAARRASQHGGYRILSALHRPHAFAQGPHGARRRYSILAAAAASERT